MINLKKYRTCNIIVFVYNTSLTINRFQSCQKNYINISKNNFATSCAITL